MSQGAPKLPRMSIEVQNTAPDDAAAQSAGAPTDNRLDKRVMVIAGVIVLGAIMSILDMSLHYTDCFVSFAGDTTHDISRASLRGLNLSRHHRSRRLRQQRRNVIGFSDAPSTLPAIDPGRRSKLVGG